MKPNPTFQFSTMEKEFYTKLQKAIKKLDGNYDLSKTYSTKASHLIVDKMVCTEKILCFISAGKWILTQSYIKSCLRESVFLDELNFHVSTKFPNSKLARISLKWMEGIKKGIENSPFHGWDVAIFMENEEKSSAVSRIIKAGNGNFACLGQTARFNRSFSSRFTLVVYDEPSKVKAIDFASNLNILAYPFQSIPDYLMQGIKSDLPVLSIDYYEQLNLNGPLKDSSTKNDSNNKIKNVADELSSKMNSQDKDIFLIKFKRFLRKCNQQSKETDFLDSAIDDQFMNLWLNKAYFEAFFVLPASEFDKLPSLAMITALFEFLLMNSNTIKKTFKLRATQSQSVDSLYEIIYYKVLTYLTSKIIFFPSICEERYKYFDEVFSNLMIEFRLAELKQGDLKGLIDVIYLISIHDYLMINLDKKATSKSLISKNKLEKTESFNNFLDTISNDKNMSQVMLDKLLEILAFVNTYVSKSKLYKRFNVAFNECIANNSENSNLKNIFAETIDDFNL